MPTKLRFTPLAVASASALAAHAMSAAPASAADDRDVTLPTIEVRSEQLRHDGQQPPQIEENQILAGKKVQRVELTEQPAISDNNLRQVFARTPGLFVSEQPIPSHYNVNYRGLGNPHESEFVLFAVDGIPIASDWFGYPTVYYTPNMARVERVDFLRGGAALLYGPQPGPVLNFIMRRPEPGQETRLRADLIAGEDNFFSAYGEAAGGDGNWGWQLAADSRQGDGQRDKNSGFRVDGFNGALVWQPDANQRWEIDIDLYDSESEEPGRLTDAQYRDDPDQTTAPFNRIWVDRWSVTLGHERVINDNTSLVAKVWHSYLDRFSRRTSTFTDADPTPEFTTFDRQEFTITGADLRLLHEWGANHSLTVGTTLYHSDSPREQKRNTDLTANSGDTLRYRQDRVNRYAAVFAENAFRYGAWTLVPALRFEWLEMSIDETDKLASLERPAIDRDFSRTEPLLGFGFSRDIGEHWQFYGNLSEAYRPMRYDDIANPTAELTGGNDPELSKAENIEFGVRGLAAAGVYVDASVFQVNLRDKIEQVQINATDVERINSGDARHRGVEVTVEYDLLKARDPNSTNSLVLYANGAFLDAEITESTNDELVGNTPAFAPDTILRGGVIWHRADGAKVALTGTHVSEQYWQDSNGPRGSGASLIPAEVPSFTVWDLAAEWPVGKTVTLLGNISNLADEEYFSRVRNDGIEPAPGRHASIGLRVDL